MNSPMTSDNAAPAEMPGVEEIARVIASWRHRSTPANPYRPSILPSEMAQASAIFALFAPILAEKEREIATFENREAEWNEAIANSLQNEEDAHRKLEAAEAALAAERERVEQLHATIRKAHVAMTMACALPGVASEYDFSEAIASTEATLARRAAAIRAEGPG